MNANPREHRMGDESGGGGSDFRPGYVRPVTSPTVPTSQLHFDVSPALPELVAYAENRSWPAHGFSAVSISWQQLHWTVDGWKTVNTVSSNDVPCPITNGWFTVPVKPGTSVAFALHVGLQCRAQQDTAGAREVGDVWFNDGGKNYSQITR